MHTCDAYPGSVKTFERMDIPAIVSLFAHIDCTIAHVQCKHRSFIKHKLLLQVYVLVPALGIYNRREYNGINQKKALTIPKRRFIVIIKIKLTLPINLSNVS